MSSYFKWNKIRQKIFLKDYYMCRICFSKSNLCVHHKDGSGDWKNNVKSNNDVSNLVTLCKSCRSIEHWKQAKASGRSNLYQ